MAAAVRMFIQLASRCPQSMEPEHAATAILRLQHRPRPAAIVSLDRHPLRRPVWQAHDRLELVHISVFLPMIEEVGHCWPAQVRQMDLIVRPPASRRSGA